MRNNAIMVCALMMGQAGVARADIATTIYDDAKSIITDLITDELSRQIVPRLACHGRHEECTSDAACGGALTDFTVAIGPRGSEKKYVLSLLYHYNDSLQRVYAHQFGSLRSSIRAESEDYAAFQVYEVVNSLLYDKPTRDQQSLSARGAAQLVIQGIDLERKLNPATASKKPTMAFTGDDLESCVTQVEAAFKVNKFTVTRSSPLDELCRDPEDAGTPAGAFHSRLKCEMALAVRSTLQQDMDGAKGHLLTLFATVLQLAVNVDTPLDELRQRIPETAMLLAELVDRDTIDISDFGQTIKDLVAKIPGVTGTLADLDKIEKAVRTLATAWRTSVRAAGALDLAALTDQLVTAGGALKQLCEVTAIKNTDVCTKAVAKLKTAFGRAAEWWPLIRAAAKADYRGVAHQVIGLLFEKTSKEDCDDKDDFSKQCRYVIYRRFADSLVTYFMDTVTDGGPADGSRAAFRAAAEDVLRDVAAFGGMDRGAVRYHLPRYIPDLELTATYSEGYGMGRYSTTRTAASLRLFTWRRPLHYTRTSYIAVHFSFVDVLAPFAELATRPDEGIHYENSWRLVANLLNPKFELVLGLPQLSKHLTVGAGVSGRLVAPVLGADAAGNIHAEYVFAGTRLVDPKKFLELGVFVKYLL